jgi:hypothetical protein
LKTIPSGKELKMESKIMSSSILSKIVEKVIFKDVACIFLWKWKIPMKTYLSSTTNNTS